MVNDIEKQVGEVLKHCPHCLKDFTQWSEPTKKANITRHFTDCHRPILRQKEEGGVGSKVEVLPISHRNSLSNYDVERLRVFPRKEESRSALR